MESQCYSVCLELSFKKSVSFCCLKVEEALCRQVSLGWLNVGRKWMIYLYFIVLVCFFGVFFLVLSSRDVSSTGKHHSPAQ